MNTKNNTPKIFSLDDLVDFFIKGDHNYSDEQAVDFLMQFMKYQEWEISRQEVIDILNARIDEVYHRSNPSPVASSSLTLPAASGS